MDIIEKARIFAIQAHEGQVRKSEPDKSLSWHERKKHTIERVKDLDLRHKAIVCADKINNLEDIKRLIDTTCNFDFSNFNKGYDDQKWYYINVYNSLILNEDINNPMFVRLKKVIDSVFEVVTI